MPQAADHNLLFVVVALQNDLVRRGPLLAALADWSRAKHRSVADVLVKFGALSAEDRDVVEALIEAHFSENDAEFAAPAPFVEAPSLRRSVADLGPGDLLAALADSSLETEGVGTEAAPDGVGASAAFRGFELIGELGRGGMGVVYRARDLSLDREVAVKVLHERYDPDSAAALRFLEEARITGQLQHPGVPAVYQVGALPGGRPFLAMKLIKGDTLDALLATRSSIDIPAVIEAVCQAVGYAHARDVIHRDLKPSNVMVGAFGEVQVMDWGLAKILATSANRQRSESDPESTTAPTEIRSPMVGETPMTLHGSVLGTPSYMAPEQAAGELDKVGTPADVFGLGAILCVMLTGKPPFTGKDSDSVRVKAVRGDVADAFARLDACGNDPDLIALCKRCLAFMPEDRPRDANEVAGVVAAIRRATEERARLAEHEKRAAEVRAAEQARRRRVVQSAALAVTTVLLLGIGGTTAGMMYAQGQRKAADDANEQTKKRLVQIERGVELFAGLLENIEKDDDVAGGPTLFEQLRTNAEKAADALDAEAVGNALAMARLQVKLGGVLIALDNPFKAVPLLEKARETFEGELGQDHPSTLEALMTLAGAIGHSGDPLKAAAVAETLYRRSLAAHGANDAFTVKAKAYLGREYLNTLRIKEAIHLLEQVRQVRSGAKPDDETLSALNNLAVAYSKDGRERDSVALFEQILKFDAPKNNWQVLATRTNLGSGYRRLGRVQESIATLEQARLDAAKYPPDHVAPVQIMQELALSYQQVGRAADAVLLFTKILDVRSKKFPNHEITFYTMENLALAYEAANDFAAAIRVFEQLYAARKAQHGPEAEETLITLSLLANAHRENGDMEKAIEIIERIRRPMEAKLGADNMLVMGQLGNLATAYWSNGQFNRSVPLFEETVRRQTAKIGPTHPQTLMNKVNLAMNYTNVGKLPEAKTLLEEAIPAMADPEDRGWAGRALLQLHMETGNAEEGGRLGRSLVEEARRRLPKSSLKLADELEGIARPLMKGKAFTYAAPLLRESLEIMKRDRPDRWETFGVRATLGAALVGCGQFTDAEPHLLSAFDGMTSRAAKMPPIQRQRIKETAGQLVKVYESLGKTADAEKWRNTAVSLKPSPK